MENSIGKDLFLRISMYFCWFLIMFVNCFEDIAIFSIASLLFPLAVIVPQVVVSVAVMLLLTQPILLKFTFNEHCLFSMFLFMMMMIMTMMVMAMMMIVVLVVIMVILMMMMMVMKVVVVVVVIMMMMVRMMLMMINIMIIIMLLMMMMMVIIMMMMMMNILFSVTIMIDYDN